MTDDLRPVFTKNQLYGRRWKRRAKIFRQSHPLCFVCEKEGKIVAAECVDHVDPHRLDVNKFWMGKLRALCAHHHSQLKQKLEQPNSQSRNRKVRSSIGPDGYPTVEYTLADYIAMDDEAD